MHPAGGLGLLALAVLPFIDPLPAGMPARAADPGVGIHTDREDPYRRGERVRVFVAAEGRVHLTVFRVDTDGRVRVLFPEAPWADNRPPGRRRFELTADGRGAFRVDDYPGVGYLLAVVSEAPFDYGALASGDHWDYSRLRDGRLTGDPHVALAALAESVIAEGPWAYDVEPYQVGGRHAYPRFVCYDCHSYAGYNEWDPYAERCSRFDLVIGEDSDYYPARRFGGRRVVMPARGAFFFEERRDGGTAGRRDVRREGGAAGGRDVRREGGTAGGREVPQRERAREVRPRREGEREVRRPEGEVRRPREEPEAVPRRLGEPRLRRRKP